MADKAEGHHDKFDVDFDIFTNVEPTNEPEIQPKGGHSYLFGWCSESQSERYKADAYRWRQFGTHTLSSGIQVTYFHLIIGPKKDGKYPTDAKFRRLVYSHHNHPKRLFIRYVGDETLAVQFPHGNAKKKSKITKPFVRTNPAVLSEISKRSGAPNSIYRKLLAEGPADLKRHPVDTPRDMEQVRNKQKTDKMKHRISHDALYNVVDLEMELGSFVRYFQILPDALVFGYSDQLLEKLRGLLGRKDLPCLSLTYDTTFNRGDFYASFLVFPEIEFEEKPIVPCMYMVHERKLQECHELFFKFVADLLPELKPGGRAYFVVDEETAIVNAIKKNLPGVDVYRCWNHVVRDVRRNLSVNGIGRRDAQNGYVDHVYRLFRQLSRYDYLELLHEMRDHWDDNFYRYFKRNIHPDIDRIGLWEISKYDVKSVTTNQSESFNAVLARFTEWKEAPLDCFILCLYQIFQSYNVQIIRARYNVGDFTLRDHLDGVYDLEKDCPQLPQYRTPDEIFDQLRNAKTQAKDLASSVPQTDDLDDHFNEHHLLSVYDRALQLVREKKVTLDVERRVFVVDGIAEPRLVRLFPKTSCTCNPTRVCAHILAAQLSIGIYDEKTKKPNITLLRRRNRKRVDKTSGRKYARKKDTDKSKSPKKASTLLDQNDTEGLENDDLLSDVESRKSPKVIDENVVDEEAGLAEGDESNQSGSSRSSSDSCFRLPSPIDSKNEEGEFYDAKNGPSVKGSVSPTSDQLGGNDPDSCSDHSSLNVQRDDQRDATNVESLSDIENPPLVEVGNLKKQTPVARNPRQDRFLEPADIKKIKRDDWLEGTTLNAFMTLLRRHAPDTGGLFNLEYGAHSSNFPVAEGDRWVQIVHNGSNHWLLVSHGFSFQNNNHITVYDSLRFDESNQYIRSCCASLLKTEKDSFVIDVVPCQIQVGGISCGDFAAAFATALILGQNPARLSFHQSSLRHHLKQCLLNKKISMFPVTAQRGFSRGRLALPRQITVKVYCCCRRPENYCGRQSASGVTLVQCHLCEKWFHPKCQDVDQMYLDDEDLIWNCRLCLAGI